ncbi:HAMP domain-containing protein [bacterium]|nr:HAMP domain-containing protein [bacterium]
MGYADLSIRRKLMVIILSTSGIVLLLTAVAFISYEWLTFRRSLVINVTTLARVVSDNCTAALAFRNPADAREVLNALKAEKTIKAAVLYDHDGELFAFYPDNLKPELFPDKPGPDGYRFQEQDLIVIQPVVESKERYGTLFLRASLGVIYESLQNYAEIVILIFVLSLFAAFVLSTILTKSISNPVRSLAKAARLVSENRDYGVRVPRSGKDELGVLTQTFNEMLSRIEETDAGLRKAIGEKDVLIQEVHHRVKNNLQVILSLFDMQARHVDSEDALEVFHDCKARIRSMSLVHEMLYGSSDLSKIDFKNYVEKLADDLSTSYQQNDRQVKTTISLKDLELDISKAVPLGLLTNEVLTNSIKHAFVNEPNPEIFIKQVPSEALTILIGDNGKGLPSDIDFSNPTTFGLRIIRLLAEQLNANLNVESNHGTIYTIQMAL